MPPREVSSSIVVDETGKWFNGDEVIDNQDILLFFKKNLHSNEEGIYIYNEIHGLQEKVYITVNGPVLIVSRISGGYFVFDTGALQPIDDSQLVMDENERIYLHLSKLKAWARLSRLAKLDLEELLEVRENEYYWNKKPVRRVSKMVWRT